jgi:superfamily I DNA/RNA helicase
MAHDYLADLNEEQRRAVRHGLKDGSAVNSPPFLVIAGAGSGKTKTLANRVAHLVVNGIHPQRILLLTFSRRAALETTGRVKRITAAAMGIGRLDLPWAGTFHAIGARILREYAHRIGLKPTFTILDRSDAADLMDVVRHDLKLSYHGSTCRKQRPKTGLASPNSFVEYARPRWLGLRNFSSFETGMSRICFDCMTMLTCGRPTLIS